MQNLQKHKNSNNRTSTKKYTETLTEAEKQLILTVAQNTAYQTATTTALAVAESTAEATALKVAQSVAESTAEATALK